MSAAREAKDTPTEMIYAVVTNKIRECLFEIQQNLCPMDKETEETSVPIRPTFVGVCGLYGGEECSAGPCDCRGYDELY
jgi:hypothetical protein